jgi:hypothetical protein
VHNSPALSLNLKTHKLNRSAQFAFKAINLYVSLSLRNFSMNQER